MKRNNPAPERTRQSPLAIILLLATFAKNTFRQFWPFIIVFLINPKRSIEFQILIAVAVFSFISLVSSILSYFRFYYQLTEDGLVVEKGIFKKTRIQVPFERIQSVNIEQGLLHQAFNIVKLEIDTAGSKGNELSITALDRNKANELRSFIFERKSSQSGTTMVTETDDSGKSSPGEFLFQLSPLTLFKIGISQNHLRTLGIVLLFLFGVAENLSQVGGEGVDDYIDGSYFSEIFSSTFAILILLPVFLIVALIISVGQIAFKYADFTVFRTTEGLRLIGGLLTRIEQVAVRKKMQMMTFESNPIRRMLGLVKVRFYQASSMQVQVNQSIQIPGCSPAESEMVAEEYISMDELKSAEFFHVDPRYRVRLFLFSGLLPLILVMGVLSWNFGKDAFFVFLILPLLGIWVHLYYQRLVFAISNLSVIKKDGVFARKTTLLKTYKIQAVELSRGFYERRNNLGSVVIHTAARPIVIPFLPLAQARQIVDYLLFKVESEQKNWM